MAHGTEPFGSRLVAGLGLLAAGVSGLQHGADPAAAAALCALGGYGFLSAKSALRQHRARAADRAAGRRDPLTGLANRAQLRDDLAAFLPRPRHGDHRELLILDLVGFKKYNDTFGFACGDALLRLPARPRPQAPTSASWRWGSDWTSAWPASSSSTSRPPWRCATSG